MARFAKGAFLLADPRAVLGAFMVGASAGSALSYLYWRTALQRYRKSIETACAQFNPSECAGINCKMKALILCRDPETIGIVSHLFREVGIEIQTCSSESHLLARLISGKFEALVVDCDELAKCPELVKNLRDLRPHQHLPVFAIASEGSAKAAASSFGNSLVIERPFVLSEIRSLLRTVYGRMLRSSQAYFRMNAEIPVSLARASGPVLQCSTLNISQNGMAVITPVSLEVGEVLNLMFAIPHTDVVVSAEGTVIWDDGKGKAGIRFECSSARAQAHFFEWLHDHFCMRLDAQSVAAQFMEK
jgi:DNA-binding response OmpR family regulator